MIHNKLYTAKHQVYTRRITSMNINNGLA